MSNEIETKLVADIKTILKVRAAMAERLGRLSACVYIKEYLEAEGLPGLPFQLREQLISYCEQPTQHLTNAELNEVLAND